MTRAGITQNRYFYWTGSDLTNTTNPANGTVAYTYDGARHVTQRTDAKLNETQYTYDTNGRLTLVKHLVFQSGTYTGDLTQRVTSRPRRTSPPPTDDKN